MEVNFKNPQEVNKASNLIILFCAAMIETFDKPEEIAADALGILANFFKDGPVVFFESLKKQALRFPLTITRNEIMGGLDRAKKVASDSISIFKKGVGTDRNLESANLVATLFKQGYPAHILSTMVSTILFILVQYQCETPEEYETRVVEVIDGAISRIVKNALTTEAYGFTPVEEPENNC